MIFEKFTRPVEGTINFSVNMPALATDLNGLGLTINAKTKLIRVAFDGDKNTIIGRFKDGGQDPSATDGDPIYGGDLAVITRFQFDNIKFIAIGTPVKMHLRQFRSGNLFNL